MAENRVEGSSAAKILNAGLERKAAGKSSDAEFSFLLKEAYGKSQKDMSSSLLNSRAKNSPKDSKTAKNGDKTIEAAPEQKLRKSEKKVSSEKGKLSDKSAEGEQELGMMSVLLNGQQEAVSEESLSLEEAISEELAANLPEGVSVLSMAPELIKDGAGAGEELLAQHIEVQNLSEDAAGNAEESGNVAFAEENAAFEEVLSKADTDLEAVGREGLPSEKESELSRIAGENFETAASEKTAEDAVSENRDLEEADTDERIASEQAGIHAQQLRQNQEIRRENSEEIPKEVLSTSEGKLQEDISNLMAARVQNLRRGELLIELEPKNLGQIVMRINYVGAQARVSLFAENPKTWEILSQNAQEMAHIIEEKTGTMTAVLIEEEENRGALNQNRNGEGSGENKERAEEELEKQLWEKQQRESGDFLQQLRLGLM